MLRAPLRLTILAVASAIAIAALSGVAPGTASAASSPATNCLHDRITLDYCSTTYASPRYKGWTYLESTCPPAAMCISAGVINAWTWDGRAWSRSRIDAAQWVYVYPYTGDWRWAWTEKTGWRATNEGRFQVR